MADRWFFDDDVLRLEAQALVNAANRAAHSQPVHDCRILLLSDNVSLVLCFALGRSRDFRFLVQIRRFSSVRLARNMKIIIRWQANSTAVTGAAEKRYSACDSTESLVDHLGSSDAHAPIVNPPNKDFLSFAKLSVSWPKKWRNLCGSSWAATRPKALEGSNLLSVEDCEKLALPQRAFDAFRPRGREVTKTTVPSAAATRRSRPQDASVSCSDVDVLGGENL